MRFSVIQKATEGHFFSLDNDYEKQRCGEGCSDFQQMQCVLSWERFKIKFEGYFIFLKTLFIF